MAAKEAMSDWEEVTLDPAFTLRIPKGWEAERDEEEGISVGAEEGAGLLHLVSFPHAPGEQLDPAEELYAFLEEQEIQIEEDEVEDLDLANGAELSMCEYLAEEEEEEDGETTYWLVGVVTAPGTLVFFSYSCPAGEEEAERETVREILATMTLRERA